MGISKSRSKAWAWAELIAAACLWEPLGKLSPYFGSIDYGGTVAVLRLVYLFANLFNDLSLDKPTFRRRAVAGSRHYSGLFTCSLIFSNT